MNMMNHFWLEIKIFFASPVIIEVFKRGITLLKYSLASLIIVFMVLSRFHQCDAFDTYEFLDDGRNFVKQQETDLLNFS